MGGIVDISDTSFNNNTALGVGAVGIFSQASLKNVTFEGNKATDASDDGAGAIFLGSKSQTTIDGATFTKNTSAAVGGAIATRGSIQGNQSAATLDISNATFTENTAETKGGAIYNSFYNDAANSGFASLSTVSFDKNSAKLGGAIYNDGTGDKVVSGKNQGFASMHITDGTFTNNTASENGGAIYNSGKGVINFAGDTTFANNTAGSDKNDIYNEGTLNFNGGTVTLDGGITGNGTVNFTDGTNLKTALLADASSSAIITADTINGNINLVIENGSDGGQVKFDAANNNLTIADNNALYNIQGDDTGLFNVTKKSSSEVAASTGAAQHQADTLVALTSGTSQNESFNAISDAVNELVQSSDPNAVALGVKAAATLAPSTVHIPTTHTVRNINQIFSAVSSRLSSGSISSMGGQSSGDEILGNGAVLSFVKRIFMSFCAAAGSYSSAKEETMLCHKIHSPAFERADDSAFDNANNCSTKRVHRLMPLSNFFKASPFVFSSFFDSRMTSNWTFKAVNGLLSSCAESAIKPLSRANIFSIFSNNRFIASANGRISAGKFADGNGDKSSSGRRYKSRANRFSGINSKTIIKTIETDNNTMPIPHGIINSSVISQTTSRR